MKEIQKVKEINSVRYLFADWEETLIWSCLQGVMGEIYAENVARPRSAMAILGDFCFFAGEPDAELVKYKPLNCRQDFIIMVPQSAAWADAIEAAYGEKAKKVERYAIKKEPNVFDRVYLESIVKNVPAGYSLRMIDEALYEKCKEQPWSRDLVSQFEPYEKYRELGLGAVITRDGEVVAGASSYSAYLQGIEIEIDTREDCRRKGLALICGAKLILECLDRGKYPSWDAQNKASVALAEKLGYHCAGAYAAYEVMGYCNQ